MAVKVRERKGAWWLFIDHKGRRKAKRVGEGKEGKRAAITAAEKIQAKLALGDTALLDETRANLLTFETHADAWLKSYAAVHLKPATQGNYEAALRNHWMPALGQLPLSAITREQIKRVMGEQLAAGAKAGTLRTRLTPLRECLNAAVEAGLIPSNPASRVLRYARRPDTEEARSIEIFAPEELSVLLGAAEREMPEAYPLLLTLARTGVRIGEGLTLKVDDLDFRQGALWVRRTWGRELKALAERQIGTPKSGKARRVDMSPQLVSILESHVTLLQAEAVVSGHPAPTWLFLDPAGGPMRPNYFYQRVWRPLLRRAGLRYRKPHTLRHSFASRLLAERESLVYVRDQLGHSSIKITVDTYGHLIPGANRQAVAKLDDATGRNLYATGVRLEAVRV